jgi:hypothetical protein
MLTKIMNICILFILVNVLLLYSYIIYSLIFLQNGGYIIIFHFKQILIKLIYALLIKNILEKLCYNI